MYEKTNRKIQLFLGIVFIGVLVGGWNILSFYNQARINEARQQTIQSARITSVTKINSFSSSIQSSSIASQN
jgi:hypothetical protein